MNISRDEFVKTLIEKAEQLENTNVSEFFANLNWEKEQIFWNIYDAAFSKKLCDVREKILNWILIAFIWSESEEPENKRLIDEITDIIPETKQLFTKVSHLLKQPTVENPKLQFEENYTDMQIFKEVKNSQISLFELFATENWQKELAKKHVISNLKRKLKPNEFEFEFAEKILQRNQILHYDMKENKIYVDINSISDRFVLRTLRNHLKPIEIVNNANSLNNVENLDIIEPDFDLFIKNYFAKCVTESWMTSLLRDCKINKISMINRHIEFSIPSADMFEKIDDQLRDRVRLKTFFPTFSFSYCLENSVDKTSNEIEAIKVSPKIIKINSPVNIQIDETKTLDNFHSLEKNKIQWIIDLIKEGKSIAIAGSTGSGKTHLAQALKNNLKSDLNTAYTTWEKFCNVFRGLAKNYESGKDKNKNNVRNIFLDSFDWIDLLIIDWIEALWWETKGPTQNILKQILNKNPDMRLVITSKTGINNIKRTKKHKTMDGAVGYESSSIFQEIKNLNLIMLTSPQKEKSEKIIEDQWINFLRKKNDLFLPRELPVGVVNFLSRKVNPSLYEQIFESIKLNLSNDFSCDEVFRTIQNLVSEKIKPEPEEIIEIIIDSFVNNGKDIAKYIALGTDITLWDKTELKERLFSEMKDDHLKNVMISLCIFFIKQSYPKKTFTEISNFFWNRKDCSKLYSGAFELLTNRKGLLKLFENNIKNFLLKTYWVDWEQISMF